MALPDPGTGDRALGALEFASLARALGAALHARGLPVPAFRSPPRDPDLMRSVRRYEGGNVVAVRLRGRERAECVRDMVAGAVVAATGALHEELVDELLLVVDPSDAPRWEPPPPALTDSGEEPF